MKTKKGKKPKMKIVSGEGPVLTPNDNLPRRTKTDSLSFGPAVSVSRIKIVSVGRSCMYLPLFEQMNKLSEGEGIVVRPNPEDIGHPIRLLNRLNSARKRFENLLHPPKGCRFALRTTEDGNVAAMCLPLKGDGNKPVPSVPKAKAEAKPKVKAVKKKAKKVKAVVVPSVETAEPQLFADAPAMG